MGDPLASEIQTETDAEDSEEDTSSEEENDIESSRSIGQTTSMSLSDGEEKKRAFGGFKAENELVRDEDGELVSIYRSRFCKTCFIHRPPMASHCRHCD